MATPGSPAAEGAAPAALRNPVYAALSGPHAAIAQVRGRARVYPSDVAPFLGLPDAVTEQDWHDAAKLVGAGRLVATMRPDLPVPDVFEPDRQFDLVQFLAPADFGADEPEAVVLGPDDVPEMLGLVALTDPGPFRARTIELGSYLGIRQGGELIAMAGERFRLPGFVEISAVCTHPGHRGRGLATRLIRAVVAGIERRGDQAFLHTGGSNLTAIRLYESLGFSVSHQSKVTLLQPA
ncbi:GCN5-related N-acetyltransferase [Kribbella flavida DSM 17836]|uniref:GCN5-related N-acetyltransferase n=1 Tax=Kribbella flavida (strain DSM 17836 / JCM 10339 / NBRC 14399) TaxID=479435 RepID=D2PV34_KRIFD|nr:GNAT family N-acetyltransferase [Kribbella flavida]ADB31500.1 GCN5-related N-acetyltransferase [Kribbella flavida DSM 17836]